MSLNKSFCLLMPILVLFILSPSTNAASIPENYSVERKTEYSVYREDGVFTPEDGSTSGSLFRSFDLFSTAAVLPPIIGGYTGELTLFGGVDIITREPTSTTFGSARITGSNDFRLISNGCQGRTLSTPQSLCIMTVQFTPTKLGQITAMIEMESTTVARCLPGPPGSPPPGMCTLTGFTFVPLFGEGKYAYPPVDTETPKLLATNNSNRCPANSSVEIDSLSLNEKVPLVGVPFHLHYASAKIRDDQNDRWKKYGLGGWLPSVVHFYDAPNKTIHMGSGSYRDVEAIQKQDKYYVAEEDGRYVYEFNSNGLHISTIDSYLNTKLMEIGYDSTGKISFIKDQFSNQTSFQYSTNQVMIVSPYNQTTIVSLNSNNNLISVKNPANEIYAIEYNSLGLLSAFTKPNGQRSTVEYDADGYVTKDTGAFGDILNFTRQINAETGEQTVMMSTALGRSTRFVSTPTETGAIRESQSPSGEIVISNDGTKEQSLQSSTDGETYSATNEPDPRFGWMAPYTKISTTQISGSNVQLKTETTKNVVLQDQSDPLSLLSISVQTRLQNDPLKNYQTVFSSADKTTTITSPMGKLSKIKWNNLSLIESIQTGSLMPTLISYDSRGRMIQTSQAGRKTEFTYNDQGLLQSEKNAIGQTKLYSYDLSQRVSEIQQANGDKITFTYDKNGNLTSLTPPSRPPHVFVMNLADLTAQYLPPSLEMGIQTPTNYSYNTDKQLSEIKRPDGTSIKMTYLSNGLNSQIQTPRGSYQFSYFNSSSRLRTAISPDSIQTEIDYSGSLPLSIVSSGPVSSRVDLSYQSDGLIQAAKYSAATTNQEIRNSYDKDDFLIQTGNLKLNYDSSGLVSSTSIGKIDESITYNNVGELIKDEFKFGKKFVWSIDIKRDALGRIIKLNENDKFEHQFCRGLDEKTFDYDSNGRLIGVYILGRIPLRKYTYDAQGNRIKVVQTLDRDHVIQAKYDAQDRLIRYGNTEYFYNLNGELIQKTEYDSEKDFTNKNPKKRKVTNYSYNSFGNMISAKLPTGELIEYLLDAQDRRVGKKINGKLTQAFIYQSQTQIASELDANGKIIKQFVYGTKTNVPDYMIYNGKEYKIISDQVGTPKLLVDSQSGKVIESYNFDEFGISLRNQKNPLIPFGFAGGTYDLHTQLVHFGARDYDAEVGRWTSKDPIRFDGGMTNLYGYSFNDPVNFIDSNGKSPLLVAGLITGLLLYLTPTATDTPGEASNEITNGLLTVGGGALGAGGAVGPKVVCEGGKQTATNVGKGLFGAGGLLNSNRYLRIGMGRNGGDRVFRIAGDLLGGKHIDLWNFGPL